MIVRVPMDELDRPAEEEEEEEGERRKFGQLQMCATIAWNAREKENKLTLTCHFFSPPFQQLDNYM